MKRSLATGVLSVFGGKAATFVVTLVTTPVLVRYLGSGQYGDYAFLMSVFAVVMILVSSGVGDGVRKFVVEERSVPHWESHVVGFYLRHATLLALAGSAAVALLAATGLVDRLIGPEVAPQFYLLAALVVVAQFRELVRRTLMGFGQEHYAEGFRVVRNAVFAVVGIGLVALGYGIGGVLIGHLVAGLLVAVAGLAIVHRHASLSYVFARTPASFPRREMLTFNGYTVVFILLLSSLYHVDLLMLRPMAGSDQTGYYKGALALAEFLWFAPVALQTVFVHSTSELWSRDRSARISELASRTTRFTLLFTALLAIGIGALADVFVPLYYGEDFTPAVRPLLLLLPGALGFAVARPIFAIGQGKGDMRPLVAATGGAALLNAGLNLLLIPRYGMAGAAVATSAGYASMLGVHVVAARAIGFDPLQDLRPVRVGATVGLSGIAILSLARRVDDAAVALLVVPPAGALLFAVLAVASGAVDLEELSALVAEVPLPEGSRERLQALVPSTRRLELAVVILGVVLLVGALVLAPVSSVFGAFEDGSWSGDDAPGPSPPERTPVVDEPSTDESTSSGETRTATPTATRTEPDANGDITVLTSTDTPISTPRTTRTATPTPARSSTATPTPDSPAIPTTSTPAATPTTTPSPSRSPSTTPTPTPSTSPSPTPTPTPTRTAANQGGGRR